MSGRRETVAFVYECGDPTQTVAMHLVLMMLTHLNIPAFLEVVASSAERPYLWAQVKVAALSQLV